MITIELNGKTREISIEDWLTKDLQDILADDIGSESDPLSDFLSLPNAGEELIQE